MSHLISLIESRTPFDPAHRYPIYLCVRSLTGAGPAIHPTIGNLIDHAREVDEQMKIMARPQIGQNLIIKGYWEESGFETVPISVAVDVIPDDQYHDNKMNGLPIGEGRHGFHFPLQEGRFKEDGFDIKIAIGEHEAKFLHAEVWIQVVVCDPAWFTVPEMFRGKARAYCSENLPIMRIDCANFRLDGVDTVFEVHSMRYTERSRRRIVETGARESHFAKPLWADVAA